SGCSKVRDGRQGDGLRSTRVWKQLLGVEQAVIEEVDLDGEAAAVVVAKVRPTRGQRSRCSRCGRRCRGYDRGRGDGAGGRWTSGRSRRISRRTLLGSGARTLV
nr:hypothetical protein [Actinomycetota bacterium]